MISFHITDSLPFMLVCDMSVIRLYNTLSTNDIGTVTDIHSGIANKDSFSITDGNRFLSTFTAMVLNEETGDIYFTDTTR